MSEPCCAATTRAGHACAARPLPGSDFCLFHDPARQPALTASRRQGGAAPRRRTRRYPLLLDYKHVAELLSELLVEALNEPAPLDAPRLRALTGLSTVLLKAVGRPKGTYEIHHDRSEPDADEDHLLRIYPPDSPEITGLLAADAEIEAAPEIEAAAQTPNPSDPSDPSAPAEPAPAPQLPTPNAPPPTPIAANAIPMEFDPRFRTPPADLAAWRAAYYASPDSAICDPDRTRFHPGPEPEWQPGDQDPEQDNEQDPNKPGTGTPATAAFSSPVHADPPVDAHPNAQSPAVPASVSPCLRVETPSSTVLSVSGPFG